MTKEEIKQRLKETFKDFKFYPSDHHYECKGKRVGVSVTKFIEEYANEFNQQEVAEKVAIRDNKSVQEVLNEWKYKNEFACKKGSVCHLYAQSLWNGEIAELYEWNEQQEFINVVDKIVNQANDFYEDYQDTLEHLFDELPIGSEEYDIASCVDHLFYNKLTGGLVLVDYKTNSILKGYNDDIKNRKYTKKMKIPLNKIEDDSLHHYYIQLSIYKFLIEKYTGLKVDEMFIVYFSENIDNYEIIDVPYLEKEVKEILEWRKWE